MSALFMDFLTIQLPTYFFIYMAITLIYRNRRSMINRVAALLMGSLVFYFMFEYLKTSLLPEYQMQLVLYGSAPSLLLFISTLVHLCTLLGGEVTYSFKRLVPIVYVTPYLVWLWFIVMWDHQLLYNVHVTDGRSPLHPTYLLATIIFVIGYILLSVVLLAVSWYHTVERRRRKIFRSLLASEFLLFGSFAAITTLLQSGVIVTRVAMICYFIGYLVWAIRLRHLIGKYNIMPDYRKLFQVLFESAPTAILLLDAKGSIKKMNPRAQSWFEGIPAADIAQRFEFRQGQGLQQLLASYVAESAVQSHWEMRVNDSHKQQLDLIVGIDRIEDANEDLFVLHLTNVTVLKDTERRLIESEQSYKHSAYHDPLTGLYNRTALEEELRLRTDAIAPFAVVMIDLNYFKPINDTYGHAVGDMYLKFIADLLQNLLHKPGDVVGRIGGDEFILLLSVADANYAYVAELVDRRLMLLDNKMFWYGERGITVSFAAGMSIYTANGENGNSLLRLADEDMYQRKRAQRKSRELLIREL
ncbi:sensor domain-containing diguanylate cyclase [Paenibacillus campi]|uniref:GGDEF domain-containing protein n=1 Tax=Paenibacillus campi TaxID=3106031 RepID=UPI002AFF1449|nr:sensor domain-containing diguanylate cyclase [Paenibacillus sp. SGZ-1009]